MMVRSPAAYEPAIWHPELLVGALRSKRLTLLYGAPGPWRDGLLRRGVMPILQQSDNGRSRARGRAQVAIRFDDWGALPLSALRARIDAEFRAIWPGAVPPTLAAHLRAIERRYHGMVLLVLDAFERHLDERAERADIEHFDAELAECITHDAVPLHLMIVVDEGAQQRLRRYTRWITNFGDDFLRLPSLAGADATPWSDTDIQAPPARADDETMLPDDGTDWPLDLSLDGPAGSGPEAPAPMPAPLDAPAPAAPVGAPATAAPIAAPVAAPVDAAAAAPAPIAAPVPEPLAADATRPPRSAADAAPRTVPSEPPPSARSPPAPPQPKAPRGAGPAPARAPAATPAPAPAHAPPDAPAAAPPSFGPWPDLGLLPDAAAAHRAVPPWLTEADAASLRRLQRSPSRWPALLGLGVYMAVLFAGAWVVARWILDSQNVDATPRAAAEQAAGTDAAASAPPVNPTATPAPATRPRTPEAVTPRAAAPSPATAPPLAPTNPSAAVLTLVLALPPDASSAAPMVEELIRRVAAPAGLELKPAASNQSAALALMRTDALLAARAANAPPLQVVAPLFSEQVQVLVRNDARWDYVRQIKGLRLNIGRADGARARTARALHQQLFGAPLAAANELDIEPALQLLLQRGGPIDAVLVVSESPLLPQLPAAVRRQLRELTITAADTRAASALTAFSITRRTAAERPHLSAMNYLVAPGAPPRPHDAALRTLAAALCRAQSTLQAQGSPLLRGLRQGQQPAVGWPYVLPQAPGAACPPA